jgi:hypothetical protein
MGPVIAGGLSRIAARVCGLLFILLSVTSIYDVINGIFKELVSGHIS